ncbi:SH3 domain-containing protein [Aliiglaciecola sp. LCG003]|uniref:SH3 domain-containing protein n=1 Tax=Aliiglaciecola sp. LCG003 TaxID=3053655 RepID=UPI00257359DC|nr:SH3 domain-containing protein [Aliiglaciecola sp. LCG003]WJG08760.1 SH3 domain-containing protein [Aliiglaciecola sp. LCG003]
MMEKMAKWFFLIGFALIVNPAFGEDILPEVQIAQPYIELHTGPAMGYPVFYVATKDEWITVLKRRTNWFKVRTRKGKEGWVKLADLAMTLSSEGQPVEIVQQSFASYQQRDFEFGANGGSLDGVPSLSVVASWVWTENIATELSLSQALGDFSENRYATLSITHSPFPEWRWSPYFRLGAGQIQTKPRANLVQSGEDTRTNDLLAASIGVRYYLTQNFVLKLEYQNLVVLTERDENEELEEWKLGFAVFF